MKMAFLLLAFCHMLLWTNAAAQGTDSLNWFPYKTWDLWEYRVSDGLTVDTVQIINIKDSVSADGKIHLTQLHRFIYPIMYDPFRDFVEYTIDTVAQVVFGPLDPIPSINVPIFRFNAQQGDKWVMYAHLGGGFEMARVRGVYDGILFDRTTTFMEMLYYGVADSADTLGLSRYSAILAKGFGLVYRGGGDQAWQYDLRGGVINGVLYGDTTGIPLSVDGKNEQVVVPSFKLHQNYPNPFNPATAITFDLKTFGSVTLIIYDMMGREIRRLVDDEGFIPGPHKIIWDGRANSGEIAATGIYHYRLLHNNEIVTRSMIFLK